MNNTDEQQEPFFLVFRHQFEMPNPYNGQMMTLPSGYYVVPYPIANDKVALMGRIKDISRAANSLLYFSIN
jgi:hypothetical protein